MKKRFYEIKVIGNSHLYEKCSMMISSMVDVPVKKLRTDIFSRMDIMDALRDTSKEVLVLSIMNPYIFSTDVVKKSNLTILNVHHGLLPGHRGRNVYAWNIYFGDEAGFTWHMVDEGIDTGKIIKTYPVDLLDDDTLLSLLRRENELIIKTFPRLFPLFLSGEFDFEQPVKRNEYFHLSSDIPNQGELDLSWSGEKISRFLRAMDFGPLRIWGRPYFTFNERKYTVISYHISYTDKMITNSEFHDETLSITKNGIAFQLRVLEESL